MVSVYNLAAALTNIIPAHCSLDISQTWRSNWKTSLEGEECKYYHDKHILTVTDL